MTDGLVSLANFPNLRKKINKYPNFLKNQLSNERKKFL